VGHSAGKQSVSLGRATASGFGALDVHPSGLGGGNGASAAGNGGGGGASGGGRDVPRHNVLGHLKIPARISQA
jgi:hypothetical protein